MVSCDGVIGGLNEEDASKVAFVGMLSLLHTTLYVEEHDGGEGEPSISLQGIGDEGLTFSVTENEVLVNWDGFDLGESMQALFNDPIVPEGISDDLLDFILPNQIVIISGSAHAIIDEGTINVTMKLRITNFEVEEIPNGTFNLTMTLTQFGIPNSVPEIEATVNGVKVTIDAEAFR